MKRITATAASILLLAGAAAAEAAESHDAAQTIIVTRSGEQPASPGSAEYFSGSVRMEPLFQAQEPPRTSAGSVTFQAGARSAWHTHPLGQVLIVTAGEGRVQRWESEPEVIRAGDVVWIPPGQKHWHGASPTTSMTHIAIQSVAGGRNVDWMEKVTDEQYRGASPAPSAAAPALVPNDLAAVAPALERFTRGTLGDVWKRPGLSPRDRSLVTLAVLVARNQTAELPMYVERALVTIGAVYIAEFEVTDRRGSTLQRACPVDARAVRGTLHQARWRDRAARRRPA